MFAVDINRSLRQCRILKSSGVIDRANLQLITSRFIDASDGIKEATIADRLRIEKIAVTAVGVFIAVQGLAYGALLIPLQLRESTTPFATLALELLAFVLITIFGLWFVTWARKNDMIETILRQSAQDK